MMCATKRVLGLTNSQDCRKRNCVYETWCMACYERQDKEVEAKYSKDGKKKVEEEKKKLRRYKYIGETNRSPFERGRST